MNKLFDTASEMKGLFITGTDTGVGKTVVAASVLSWLRKTTSAAPMKPVQTGAYRKDRRWHAPDLDFSLNSSRMTLSSREYKTACPYCYEPACSPHLAARRARRPISIGRICTAACYLHRKYGFVVVEGAGGVLTPLGPGTSMLDLMRAMQLPALVVSRAGLGTLNHTFLTLQAVRSAEIPVLGIVLWARHWGYIELDNLRTISSHGGLPVRAFPYCPSAHASGLAPEDLLKTEKVLQELLAPWLVRTLY